MCCKSVVALFNDWYYLILFLSLCIILSLCFCQTEKLIIWSISSKMLLYTFVDMHYWAYSLTSWYSTSALACGACDTVSASEFHIGELRYISIFSILIIRSVCVLLSRREGILIFLLGQVWVWLAHGSNSLCLQENNGVYQIKQLAKCRLTTCPHIHLIIKLPICWC